MLQLNRFVSALSLKSSNFIVFQMHAFQILNRSKLVLNLKTRPFNSSSFKVFNKISLHFEVTFEYRHTRVFPKQRGHLLIEDTGRWNS